MCRETNAAAQEERKDEQAAERNELEIRYGRYRGILKNLTLMSDVFMRNVFKERACTEYVLQVIMGRKDLKVTAQVLQKDYKNLQGRSAILAKRVHELNETQKGVDFMCREMDAIYREGEMRGEMRGELRGEKRGEERGRIKGQAEKAKEMALSLANMGISAEQIAEAAKVSVNLVQEWLSGNKEIAG